MRNTIKNISFIFLIISVTNIFYHPSQASEISGTKGSKIFGEIISTFNQPWAISFINSNTMLVTTKGGMLWLVDSSGFKKSIANIPKVSVGGQGGLGDVIIHPDFASNNLIYLSYVSSDDFGISKFAKVIRAKL